MRPYLEMKVVKVKKPYREVIKFMGKKYEVYIKDGKVSIRKHKHQMESKGNWVNNENLDKIKFPCFCSYVCNDIKWLGEINKFWKAGYGITYYLSNINEQKNYSMVEANSSLKKLIENRNIHILKGKIILFEEDKELEKYDVDIEEE